MSYNKIINKTAEYVREKMTGEGTGHDWWHIYRVWKTSAHIAKIEHADLLIVDLAALLHDIADWKFHGGDFEIGWSGVVGNCIARSFCQNVTLKIE